MTDGTHVLVLDRFEEDDAVLLVEQDGELVDEIILPEAMLPPSGRHQDAIFTVEMASDAVELRYESETTKERKQQAQDRFDQLSQRLPKDNSQS